MGKLVLIGGGIFSETTPFLEEIVRLSEKANPNVLIIPTAGKDSERAYTFWCDQFEQLGADVKPLYLVDEPPGKEALEALIFGSDVIYVPGGDTLFMMRLWRKLGVDKVLKRAYRKGIVLSGRSAGAACWFRHGISGEPSTKGTRFYGYRRMTGVGLLDAAFCAHYQDRREPFRVFLQQFGGVGVGLDDYQAMIIQNETYKIMSLNETCRAYKVWVEDRKIDNFSVPTLCEDVLEARETFQLFEDVLNVSSRI